MRTSYIHHGPPYLVQSLLKPDVFLSFTSVLLHLEVLAQY